MPPLFDILTQRLSHAQTRLPPATGGRVYRCVCDRPVFFRNSRCLGCSTALGYDSDLHRVIPVEPAGAPGEWREATQLADPSLAAPPQAAMAPLVGAAGSAEPAPPAPALDADGAPRRYRRCGNFESVAGCNWLARGRSGERAGAGAVRRLLAQPHHSRPVDRAEQGAVAARRARQAPAGLAAAVARPAGGRARRRRSAAGAAVRLPARRARRAARVSTGHMNGLITLNIEEADDVRREASAHELREPYRTLLGHFRHEVGHYYWDRLVLGTPWLEPFRELFGDERADYAAALRSNYEQGPRARLAAVLRQRLCQLASVGGLGRDLGALPAHDRHGRHRAQLRPRYRARRDRDRAVRRRRAVAPDHARRRPTSCTSSTPGCS